MNRIRHVAVLLMIFLLTAGAARGESGSPEGTAEAYPPVIDRWTDPEACPGFSFSGEDDLLEIWFPRIRDRDAAILLYQGECWMIDCSDEQAEERVVPLIRALGIEKVDKLFNTHPHHDHINGLAYVDEAAPVEELLIGFPEDINTHMKAAVAYAQEKGIRIEHFEDEQVFSMGDGLVQLKCWMKTPEEEDLNNRSAQMMVSFGDRNILFMADLEWPGEKALMEVVDPEDLKADLLRYPHHGKQPLITSLYEAISPDFVIVTSTEGVAESREVMTWLRLKHIPTAFTTNGYLRLATDGTTWLCEKREDGWLPKVHLHDERK